MNMFLYNDFDDNYFIIVYGDKPLEELKKQFKKSFNRAIKTYNEQYPSCDFSEELEGTLPDGIKIEQIKPLMYNDL